MPLGDNVRAEPDLLEAVRGAKVLVFCAPHEFMHGICNRLVGHVESDAVAISLTKGMRIRPDGPQLISEMVRKKLGIDCAVLMGANIAGEIAQGQLSEGTIGYKHKVSNPNTQMPHNPHDKRAYCMPPLTLPIIFLGERRALQAAV